MTTTTIDAPNGRAASPLFRPQPAQAPFPASRRTRTSPTLTRSELRRLVIDLLG